MTNREAFIIYGSQSRADSTLTLNGIDPSLDDRNRLSYAYGIIDFATLASTDTKVGDTSEKNDVNVNALLGIARKIFDDEGEEWPLGGSGSKITGITWA